MPPRLCWIALAFVALAAPARAAGLACDAFKETLARDSGDLNASFVRPLVVSRGGGASGSDTYDLVAKARVDGSLHCRGDAFGSFEAKIAMPADAELVALFASAQRAALMAGLGWPADRADRRVRELASEAADYLRASEERGDIEIAGKVEDHLPGGMDLGVIWTRGERTFVLIRTE